MKRVPKRSPKHSQIRKSKAKTPERSDKAATASPAGKARLDYAIMRNAHDQIAIDMLRSSPVGGLAVDQLLRNDPQMVLVFREALVDVYFRAAKSREFSKATKRQVSNAKSALTRLTQAIGHLERVSTDGRDGLRMLLEGSPLDDEKGEKEVNQMASACWSIRMDVARSVLALQSAITAESKKPTTVGERRKRLRTLVDALAYWWLSGGGKSLAPNVKANRRDGDRAVVHGRSGRFLSLAIALFCSVDAFKRSEVEAAVTNVHEARLALSNSERDTQQLD
jgi:hypothetical protein